MGLIKTSILTAIATVVKILSGFIINKVIAVYGGPATLALVGQLQNFIQLILPLSNAGTAQGVVKYIAEYQTMAEKRKIFSTAIAISCVCSSMIALCLFIWSDELSQLILKDVKYAHVFVLFSGTVFLFALNTVLMSILNGQKEIKKYILVNISGSVFSLFFTSFLIMQYNITGALYALVVNQSVIFFVTLAFLVSSSWFKRSNFTQGFDKESMWKLSQYSLMALVSLTIAPVTQLFVRSYMSDEVGIDAAGYWQGMVFISQMYLMVITTSLSVYYLPRLSELDNNDEIRKEVWSGYKIIAPIVILLAGSIFLLKDYIIIIAFNDKFLPMGELFQWQMTGDVLKILSWLMGYLLIAKAMTKLFVISEIFFGVLFVLLSIYFIQGYGTIGVTYAYAMNYAIYLIFVGFVFWKEFCDEDTIVR